MNTKGELVGINSQIVSESGGNIGIGFAIPSNMAKHVMDDLRKDGRVRRAQLGVTVQAMTSDMAASLGLTQVGGAIVSSVTPGSAADRAGIKQGDIIESFNGQAIHDTNSLRNHVADAEPGSSASVAILRNGSEKTLTVKLDEANADKTARADAEPGGDDKTGLGVSVEPLTPELAARVGAPKDAHGMVVEDVNPEGRAAAAGLQSGDVIEQVNRQPVQSVDDLRAAMKQRRQQTGLAPDQPRGPRPLHGRSSGELVSWWPSRSATSGLGHGLLLSPRPHRASWGSSPHTPRPRVQMVA